MLPKTGLMTHSLTLDLYTAEASNNDLYYISIHITTHTVQYRYFSPLNYTDSFAECDNKNKQPVTERTAATTENGIMDEKHQKAPL